MKKRTKIILMSASLLFLASCGTNNFCNNDSVYQEQAEAYVVEKAEEEFISSEYVVLTEEYVTTWSTANPGKMGVAEHLPAFMTDYRASSAFKKAISARKTAISGGACITLEDVKEDGVTVIKQKDWIYAIRQGPIELFIVFPVSNLLINLTNFFGGTQTASPQGIALASIAAIIIVTFIIRSLMLLATFRSTIQTQKMQELQPEIARIQSKYSGISGNDAKTKQTQEILKLYEKHNVKMFSSMLAPFMTIPIFFAMWAAVGETWILKQGELWGVKMGTSMQVYLFKNFSYFALAIYLVSIAGQYFLIKIPQWRQKAKMKRNRVVLEAKVLQQQKQSQTMSYVMIFMMVVIGITIPIGVSFYLITSNLFSIGQQFFVDYYINKRKGRK